jgi:hypothetical protein
MVASGGDGTGGSSASFSPYGTGNGLNGAGYLSNGSVTNATFQFLKPTGYLDGGFGNICIKTVVPEEGGFGGGQSPVATGISGGGGYTGSPGDGVSGATCYGAGTITDLGAASNTNGYVTVSIIDPPPLKQTWTWDSTQEWSLTNQIGIGMSAPVWSSSLGQFVAVGQYGKTFLSPDGKAWSIVQNNLAASNTFVLVASTSGILLALKNDAFGSLRGAFRSLDGVSWTLTKTASFSSIYSIFANNLFILTDFVVNVLYTSPDGITWTTITPNITPPIYKAYGNGVYVGTYFDTSYTSSDLTTWSVITDSNVLSSSWTSVAFSNGTFVVIKYSLITASTQLITSTDGTNWYLRTVPAGYWDRLIAAGDNFIVLDPLNLFVMSSQDKGVTWSLSYGVKSATTGVYSPTLNYFLLTDKSIFVVSSTSRFYISPTGKFIVPAISGGSVGYPSQLVWADTLGIIVAVTAYTVLISTDGINWKLVLNLKPDGGGSQNNNLGVTVSWSRELGIILAYFCNNNTRVQPDNLSILYTSYDGITWTRKVLAQPFTNGNPQSIPCKPCWSPELGLFTIGNAISRDGFNWVFGGTALNCVAWSPTLKLFVGAAPNSNPFYSSDGQSWTQANSPISTGGMITSAWSSIAWSPTLKLFVGVGQAVSGQPPFFIYKSSDGKNWTLVYSENRGSAYAGCVVWSPELSLFVVQYRFGSGSINNINMLTSTNGSSWTSAGTNIVHAELSITDLIWSPALKIFTSSTIGKQSGMYNSTTASKTF